VDQFNKDAVKDVSHYDLTQWVKTMVAVALVDDQAIKAAKNLISVKKQEIAGAKLLIAQQEGVLKRLEEELQANEQVKNAIDEVDKQDAHLVAKASALIVTASPVRAPLHHFLNRRLLFLILWAPGIAAPPNIASYGLCPKVPNLLHPTSCVATPAQRAA
jgi:hypothetical protein